MTRFTTIFLVVVAFITAESLVLAAGAGAVVVCQKKKKKKKITLRPEVCKKKEVQIASLGDDPTGIWRYTTGGSEDGSVLSGETGSKPEFITFNADGTGRLNLVDPDTNVLTCGGLMFSRGSALTVDVSQFFFTTAVWLHDVDGDVLSLSDAGGNVSTFGRAPEVASEFECKPFAENARFDGLPEPEFFTGLAFDGTSLWYEEENTGMIQQVDPATGTLGSPADLAFSQFSHVHAIQAGDFWTHCGCGNSEDAQRRTMAGADVDTVNTRTDLADQISIRAIAYDEAGGMLMLHGFSFDTGVSRLLQVNSDAEPDVLISGADLDVRLEGMSFDGADLWGITGSFPQAVVQIDPIAAQVKATYSTPGGVERWVGIASVGSQLYLLGESSGEAVIVAVTP
jgi:hypothetical protein